MRLDDPHGGSSPCRRPPYHSPGRPQMRHLAGGGLDRGGAEGAPRGVAASPGATAAYATASPPRELIEKVTHNVSLEFLAFCVYHRACSLVKFFLWGPRSHEPTKGGGALPKELARVR
jgi:hypothetical protein